jgi:hypothetical protein
MYDNDQQAADEYFASEEHEKQMRKQAFVFTEAEKLRKAHDAKVALEKDRKKEDQRSNWAQMSAKEKDLIINMMAEELANERLHGSATSQPTRKYLAEIEKDGMLPKLNNLIYERLGPPGAAKTNVQMFNPYCV